MTVRIRRKWSGFAITLVTACVILMSVPFAATAQEENSPGQAPKGLMKRIDFGSAHILGQSIKSGAVYLMHRKKSDIKNMLEVRENYRKEIIEDYGLEKTAIASGDVVQPEGQRK